jgi:hypothetical protein
MLPEQPKLLQKARHAVNSVSALLTSLSSQHSFSHLLAGHEVSSVRPAAAIRQRQRASAAAPVLCHRRQRQHKGWRDLAQRQLPAGGPWQAGRGCRAAAVLCAGQQEQRAGLWQRPEARLSCCLQDTTRLPSVLALCWRRAAIGNSRDTNTCQEMQHPSTERAP